MDSVSKENSPQGFWNLDDKFLELKPNDALKGIIEADKKNYVAVEKHLGETVKLLDKALSLLIEALQQAYRQKGEWKNNICTRTALAMAGSTLNYLLLCRHSALLGYYPELRDLLRACYERATRCFLFFNDEKSASEFLAGGVLRQQTIDNRIRRLYSPEEAGSIHDLIRAYYTRISGLIHPNLQSFEARYGSSELDKTVGLNIILGGLQSESTGRAVILVVLSSVLEILNVLGIIIVDESGSFQREWEILNKSRQQIARQLSSGPGGGAGDD